MENERKLFGEFLKEFADGWRKGDVVPAMGRWTELSDEPYPYRVKEKTIYGLVARLYQREDEDKWELVWLMDMQPDGEFKDFLRRAGVPRVLLIQVGPEHRLRADAKLIFFRLYVILWWIYRAWRHGEHLSSFYRFLLTVIRHHECSQLKAGLPCYSCLFDFLPADEGAETEIEKLFEKLFK